MFLENREVKTSKSSVIVKAFGGKDFDYLVTFVVIFRAMTSTSATATLATTLAAT